MTGGVNHFIIRLTDGCEESRARHDHPFPGLPRRDDPHLALGIPCEHPLIASDEELRAGSPRGSHQTRISVLRWLGDVLHRRRTQAHSESKRVNATA